MVRQGVWAERQQARTLPLSEGLPRKRSMWCMLSVLVVDTFTVGSQGAKGLAPRRVGQPQREAEPPLSAPLLPLRLMRVLHSFP